MKFMKIKLLIIAVIMFAASSAFASLSTYEVTINTSNIDATYGVTSGYLYLQYASINSPVASTATVSNLVTDATMGAVVTGSAYGLAGGSTGGPLPTSVVLSTSQPVTDYEQAITSFGNTISFLVTLSSTPGTGTTAASTFNVELFADPSGATALLNPNGGGYAGVGAEINLLNNGTTSATSLDASTTATPTPIPAAAWLLGSGIMGLAGIRRRKQI